MVRMPWTRPPRSMGCYTYWSGVPAQPGGQLYGRPGLAAGVWPTNDGLLMTYLAWPAARFAEFRRDVEGNFLRSMDDFPVFNRVFKEYFKGVQPARTTVEAMAAVGG